MFLRQRQHRSTVQERKHTMLEVLLVRIVYEHKEALGLAPRMASWTTRRKGNDDDGAHIATALFQEVFLEEVGLHGYVSEIFRALS
jgi:hypothetical protein